MKPVIGCMTDVPSVLRRRLRGALGPNQMPIVKYDGETWINSGPIPIHEDSTALGLATYGVILLNDARLHLVYQNTIYALPVGQTYRINARLPHGALCHHGWSGADTGFAFLAWDIPDDTPMQEFYAKLIPAIERKADGQEPLDCEYDFE